MRRLPTNRQVVSLIKNIGYNDWTDIGFGSFSDTCYMIRMVIEARDVKAAIEAWENADDPQEYQETEREARHIRAVWRHMRRGTPLGGPVRYSGNDKNEEIKRLSHLVKIASEKGFLS